jgi:uncharacterized protein YyaL (SSP411 family)
MQKLRLALLASICAASPAFAPAFADAPIKWSGWESDVFARAKAEKRFVILDLEAVWCHWCHVQDEKTYADPKVQKLIGQKYIAVRADQDASPDLSSRYGDWGWPATIIFAPDGTELAKRRGYIEPERMAALLKAVIADPTPGPSVGEEAEVAPSSDAYLSRFLRTALLKTFNDAYDSEHGGWGGGQHFIDPDSMDLDLELSLKGDRQAEAQAKKTLDAALALIDPVWGGVDQYSATPDWASPHYEKIMSVQAQYLRQYAQAYDQMRDPRYAKAAGQVYGYLKNFLLGPDGAFYVSQDADLSEKIDGEKYYALDDSARRKLGMPRIDKHLYARENGWAISGLVAYADAFGNDDALKAAKGAAIWVLANRALEGGGFRHDEKDRAGPYLGDTLAMGQAFIDLYAATGERDWLRKAADAGRFIGANFEDANGGFRPTGKAEAEAGAFQHAAKQLDDQTRVARFANLLARYTGDKRFTDMAAHAMRYAVGFAANAQNPMPGVLLADMELGAEPTHITVIGHKDDPEAQKLDIAARAYPALYKRLDWWDVREGPLDNPDVTYPEMDKAAAFACSNHTCSLPVFTAADLTKTVERMNARNVLQKSER